MTLFQYFFLSFVGKKLRRIPGGHVTRSSSKNLLFIVKFYGWFIHTTHKLFYVLLRMPKDHQTWPIWRALAPNNHITFYAPIYFCTPQILETWWEKKKKPSDLEHVAALASTPPKISFSNDGFWKQGRTHRNIVYMMYNVYLIFKYL